MVDDICLYMLVVLGMDPEAHDWWDVLCWAQSSGAHDYLYLCWARSYGEHEFWDICVENEALEHMKR